MALKGTDLAALIRTVPDFPKSGIMFKDITTLLQNPHGFSSVNEIFADRYRTARIDKVVGIESRGFIFGAAVALKLGAGFVPIRKKGKLPAKTIREEYALEYGTDTIEIHADAIQKGNRILLHDDLLATGGTIHAAAKLIERLGGNIVGIAFLIELDFLNGRRNLSGYDVYSIIHVEKE